MSNETNIWDFGGRNSAYALGYQISENGLTTTGITAGTTQTQAGATALPTLVVEVSTVANSGDGVILPAMLAGQMAYVFNAGANPMQLYGKGAAKINNVTATTGISVTNAKGVLIVAMTATDLRSVTGA